jgi:hypothetical protein
VVVRCGGAGAGTGRAVRTSPPVAAVEGPRAAAGHGPTPPRRRARDLIPGRDRGPAPAPANRTARYRARRVAHPPTRGARPRRRTGPVVGGEPFGVPFVVDALRQRQRAAWWTLAPSAIGDDVAQGNALAGALNRVLEAPLFGEALPYAAHLRTLRRHQHDLQPLWIVVTTDRHDAPVIED